MNSELTSAVDSAENTPLHPRSSRRISGVLHTLNDVIAALIACIGAMSMGFSLGYSSPVLHDKHLSTLLNSKDRQTWFGSLLTVGAMVGGPLGAALVGRLGRKTTLILCNVPLVVGWFLIIYATNLILLYAGRLLTGIGVGTVSMVAPLYVAEVVSANRRGPLGSAFQLLVTVGVFMSYAIGSVVSWSWLAVVGASLCFLHAVLLLFVPETPRWLLVNNDRQGALKSLGWLRGTDDVNVEFSEIDDAVSVLMDSDHESMSIVDIMFDRRVVKPLFISVSLMFFQQFSGVNAVIFYTSNIFADAGYSSNPNTPTMVVGAVLVGATLISCIIADIAGRRILLTLSGAVMTASIAVLGLYFYLSERHLVSDLGWLSLLSLLVYIAFFSLGWGPLPWLITAEVLPVRAKGLAGGLATASNWLFAFITTKEFEDLESAIDSFGAFWLFAGVCLAGVAFVLVFVPETKGKSLEEIEAELTSSR